MSTTFNHPSLGTLKGIEPIPKVVQYRCIPYASIPARFKHSQIIDHLGAFDATKYGPICPQMLGFVENQGRGWGNEPGPGCPPLEENELECLRLTISAPEGHKAGDKLPVMVWVHGGAMTAGAGASLPRESCEHLVRISAEMGTPVICVGIQYRLGWLGFLASNDFEEETEHYENGLGPGNWGIVDQRNAFLWIKKNISAFGGDPNNVTAFGESAGSISIAYHMCSTVPHLFNRAILQSGTASSLAPLSLETYDKSYRKLLRLLDIPLDISREERLQKLRSVPVQKFIESYQHLDNGYPAFPGVEGWFWREKVDGRTGGKVMAGCDWVDEIIIGDCLVEGKIFQMNIATDRPDPLTALLASSKNLIPSSLSSDLQSLLKAYSLTESTPLPNLIDQATLLSGDLIFQQMIHETASTLSAAGKRIFYYHWDFPNPYSSPFFGGIAHHFVDCLFLFQTLHEIYPDDLVRRVAEDMARYWIGFAVGGRPEGWGEYPLEGVMVVDPLEGWVMRGREEDERSERRRSGRWEIIERLQPYAQTWGDQMANRRDGFWK